MLLLNFAHPLTAEHAVHLARLLGRPLDGVLEVPTHFNPAQPFAEQVQALVDGIGLSSHEWQTAPLLINPPSLHVIACVLLAELHGRMGYFPPVLRMRPVADSVPPQFEVAEIINLQAVRDAARAKR